ncbi:MAG TPA: hypothetical protein VMF52_15425, partial [Steroidobacteraceae bacterium]|nr:hypothetical protein [Steroidobacteraceae bacterium]
MNTAVSDVAPLNPGVLQWLREAVRIGSDNSEIIASLRKQNYTDAQIVAAFEQVRPTGDALEQGVMNPPLMQRMPATLRKVDTDKLDLYVLDNCLSAKEC